MTHGVSTDPDPLVADTSDETLVAAVLRHGVVLAEQGARIQGGEVRDDPDLLLTLVGEPVAFTNGVQRARLGPEDADRRIADVVAGLQSHGVPATWWVGPGDTPADLGERLQAHGFRHDEDLPWMAGRLDGFRAHPAEVPLRVERVDGPRRQEDWLEAVTVGFGMDHRERHAMARLGEAVGYAPDAPWHRFVGLVDDRPVASSGVMLGGGVAGVYSVATAAWLRGQGIGAAMTSAAMLRARDLGYRVAVLGAAAGAVPLYQRLGFRRVCTVSMYLWEP